MEILFVVPYVPNLIRVRSYNLIRHLAARGHLVTVVTLATNASERSDVEALRPFCQSVEAEAMPRWRSAWNCLLALPGQGPLQAVYSWQPALMERVQRLAETADVVHVEHLRGARYGVSLKKLLPQRAVVWDSVDCISALFRQAARQSQKLASRWITRFELGRTERYEGWLAGQFDRVLVTSPVDREALLALRNGTSARGKISVLPNGVDLDYFKPYPQVERAPATVVISGKMSYHANVTMALHLVRDILPLIRGQRPDVRLCLVGKEPPRELLALAEDPAITVTGTVKDLRPYLQQATVAAAPLLYGVGIQNKVLEAMACGAPLVASPQAVSALQAPLGDAVGVASTAKGFAEAVLALLADSERQRQAGAAGRRYVETHHSWGAVATQLEGVYHEINDA